MTFNDDDFDREEFDPKEFAERARKTGWITPDMTLLGTNRRAAPNFPLPALGPFWAAWASRAAVAASCPVDYPAVSLLACVGGAIANVRWPITGAGWSEPPILWTGLVGSPSSGKSPGMRAAFDLIDYAENEMAAGFDSVRREYETRKVSAKALRDIWEGEVKAAAKEGATAPEMPAAAEEPTPPVRPRIRVADSTIEKLGALSAGIDRGLLLGRDELSGWVSNFDRYGGAGGDRAFFLECYGGGSYRVDRMKNVDPISIRHLSVGILGSTQPDRLSAITGGADDGLASRFVWTWPEGSPKFKLAREPFDDADARYAYGRLQQLAMGTDSYGNREPVRLRLATDAEDQVEAFAQDANERAEGTTGAFSGSLGKARGQVLRLAVILEFLWWCADGNRREPDSISAKAVTTAAGIVGGYFIGMAERVFGDASIPQAERLAMTLGRHLRRKQLRTFNARSLGREIGGDLRAPEKMSAACGVLTDCGLIREEARDGSRMGRPAKNYDVHPAVYGRI